MVIIIVIIAHMEWQGTLTRNLSKQWLEGPEEMQGDELGSCFCPPGGGRRRWKMRDTQEVELATF